MNTYIILSEGIEHHIITAVNEVQAWFYLSKHLTKLWGEEECERLMTLSKILHTFTEEAGYKLTFYAEAPLNYEEQDGEEKEPEKKVCSECGGKLVEVYDTIYAITGDSDDDDTELYPWIVCDDCGKIHYFIS